MYLHLIDIFPVLIGDLLWRGEINMIFSFHFPWWREEGSALGLFGLQIDIIGLLQRIDYCGSSIGCMQPLVTIGTFCSK